MRIAILGNSGSGKSVLARRLAGFQVATLDLDTLAWEPGRVAVARDPAVAAAELQAFCASHEAWVIEGCYGGLIEAALRQGSELLFLDPGEEACLRNCRNRPWERHKYASRTEQDRHLDALLAWVSDYYRRDGELSFAGHARLFETSGGPKRRLGRPEEATPGYATAGEGEVLLETGRLRLRRLALADAPWILRLLNEPSFIENIADKNVRTSVQAEAYLQDGPLRSYAAHGHGLNRVELKATGEPIGMCGLIKRDQFTEVDLGYALLPEFEGRGYITEAGAAVLAQGERDLGFRRFIAIVTPGHSRSIRVLERLGFEAAGTVPLEPDAEVVALFIRE